MPESAQTTAAPPAAAQPDVKTLFRRWRSGDADAGLAMAQRFSDWYYAITVMRLGDARARAPLQRACQAFADRIMEITEPENLVSFAHQLVLDEIGGNGRAPGGDFPNAITRHRSPSQLLQQAGRALPPDQLRLLHRIYAERGGGAPDDGLPHAALRARHALKRWLSENADVPFAVLPRQPVLDRAPMPLYEAARLASPEEERLFEEWLLDDLDLCKDVAEFASFSHALRAGALAELAQLADRAGQPAAPAAPRTESRAPEPLRPTPVGSASSAEDLEPAPAETAAPSGGGSTGMIVGGLLVAGLVAGAVLLYMLLRG